MVSRLDPNGLTMKVELSVIENLGFRMHTRLAPVVSEMVANTKEDVFERIVRFTVSEQYVVVRGLLDILAEEAKLSLDIPRAGYSSGLGRCAE